MLQTNKVSPEAFLLGTDTGPRSKAANSVTNSDAFSSALNEQIKKPDRGQLAGPAPSSGKAASPQRPNSPTESDKKGPVGDVESEASTIQGNVGESQSASAEADEVRKQLIEQDGNGLPVLLQPLAALEERALATPVLAPIEEMIEEGAPLLMAGRFGKGELPLSETRREAGVSLSASIGEVDDVAGLVGDVVQETSDGEGELLEQFPKRLLSQILHDKMAANTVGETGVTKAVEGNTLKGGLESLVSTLSTGGTGSVGRPLAGQPLPQMIELGHPLGQKGWDMALGKQLVMMANNRLQEAQIQLNPRHLGPIEVKVSVSQEQQATVQFTVQHAATREAIENSLPRLREMFAEQGLNLGQSDVSQQRPFAEHQGDGHADRAGIAGAGEVEEGDVTRPHHYTGSVELGVDYYA